MGIHLKMSTGVEASPITSNLFCCSHVGFPFLTQLLTYCTDGLHSADCFLLPTQQHSGLVVEEKGSAYVVC